MTRWIQIVCIFVILTTATKAESKPTLRIGVASSLTPVMMDLLKTFANSHGHISVQAHYAGSQQLVRQVMMGAELDGIILAHTNQSKALIQHKMVDARQQKIIASNTLVIACHKSQKSSLSIELGKGWSLGSLKIATGHQGVPLGAYAEQFLSNTTWQTGQRPPQLIYANNAKDATTYVRTGAADLGILYATDVLLDPNLHSIKSIPSSMHDAIHYTTMPILASKRTDLYNHWSNFLSSTQAIKIWHQHKFPTPSDPLTLSDAEADDRRNL